MSSPIRDEPDEILNRLRWVSNRLDRISCADISSKSWTKDLWRTNQKCHLFQSAHGTSVLWHVENRLHWCSASLAGKPPPMRTQSATKSLFQTIVLEYLTKSSKVDVRKLSKMVNLINKNINIVESAEHECYLKNLQRMARLYDPHQSASIFWTVDYPWTVGYPEQFPGILTINRVWTGQWLPLWLETKKVIKIAIDVENAWTMVSWIKLLLENWRSICKCSLNGNSVL